MNHKILSMLLLLIVAIGFSGVASAATIQKLVSPEIPAWDEKIVDEPAYNETVPEVPAIPAVTHEQLVSDAYWIWQCDIYKWVDAVYETIVVVDTPEQIINHPAVYETVIVVDHEAYDETIPAVYEEQMVREVPQGYFNNFCEDDYMKAYNKAVKFAEQQMATHDYSSYYIQYVHDWGYRGHFVVFFNEEVLVQEEQVIHHEAITHEEEVLVSEAYDEVIPAVTHEEQVLVSEAGCQFIMHTDVQTAPNYEDGYRAMIQVCSNLVPGWNIIYHPHDEFAAVFETVVDVPAVPAVPSYVIEHPEVFHMVHHDAIPAVYETVEVADPVTPIVEPAAEETIPMQNTGGSVIPIALAVLFVLAGIGLALRRK